MLKIGYVIVVIITAIVILCTCFLFIRVPYLYKIPQAPVTCDVLNYPFKTGDMILFSTHAPVYEMSALTKLFSGSEFNHIGIIYVDPRDGHVYVWDMVITGPRLHSIYQLNSDAHPTYYCVRPINKALDPYRFEQVMKYQYDKIFNAEVIMTMCHRCIPLLPMLRGYHWGNDQQRHCSFMAYEAYSMMGVVPYDFDMGGILPCDFVQDRNDDSDHHRDAWVKTINGYKFGDMIRLDTSRLPSFR